MHGADMLVRGLQNLGVPFVTTLSGNGLDPFYAACQRGGLRLVDFRNEQAAAFAADAAARLTRRVSVCAVSAAVGHANALIGLVNAHFDGAPLLLLSGASDQRRADIGRFQDFDHVPTVASFCKYARLVDRAERIPFYLHEACVQAVGGRPGPVHLTIPANVLAADVPDTPTPRIRSTDGIVAPRGRADPVLIEAAATLLAQAERPLLVAGTGAFYADAGDAVARLATHAALPTVVPIWDRGVVQRPAPHFLGVLGAMSGGPDLLSDVDVLVLVGARVDYRLAYLEPPGVGPDLRVIRIDADPGELNQGITPDVALLGDPRSVVADLDAALRQQRPSPSQAQSRWLDEARQRVRAYRERWMHTEPLPAAPLTGQHIVEALAPLLDDNVQFLVDGGNIGQWVHQLLANRYPEHWLTCGASGVVGWGVPGAIAARLLQPDRPVLVLSGDGAFGYAVSELETAVRHRTPFVVVLADDQAWGIVVSGQRRRHGAAGVVASTLGAVRYDLVAQGFGAVGIRIERANEIGPAVTTALASDRPTLIHVPIAVGGPDDATQ